jgi:beta-galactosidase
VELLLNGKSLGAKPLNANAAPRVWRVPFEAGKLQAIGKNQGKLAATSELKTAGKPVKVRLSTDRIKLVPQFDDVAYVTATVLDANDVEVPGADQLIHFQITGPGAIAAVDSADNASHESFQAPERRAFQGHCVAVIRASGFGRITIQATADGLTAGSIAIEGAR